MAPEVLQKQPHSKASDMYAFAITLNELASQSFPFSDCTKDNPEAHTVLEMGYGRCAGGRRSCRLWGDAEWCRGSGGRPDHGCMPAQVGRAGGQGVGCSMMSNNGIDDQ
jgi:serine/threonine protein kinase